MGPVTINPNNPAAALVTIQTASHQNDPVEIAQNFSISGTFSPTYALNLTSPTAANIAAVLATLITALQKGGIDRTT
jgi:hypothetical protein